MKAPPSVAQSFGHIIHINNSLVPQPARRMASYRANRAATNSIIVATYFSNGP